MSPTTKEAARAEWHRRIQARIGTVPPPPSEPMERWIRLQWALAKYGESFHGGLMVGYNTSGPAFAAVVAALENGFQAAAGPYQRTPTFRGLQ